LATLCGLTMTAQAYWSLSCEGSERSHETLAQPLPITDIFTTRVAILSAPRRLYRYEIWRRYW